MNTIPKVENLIDEATEAEQGTDLLQLVHNDNKTVAELFFQFSQTEEDDEKQNIFDQISSGMKIHTLLVEEILYPLVTEHADEEDEEEAEELVAEAEAGNHVASLVLQELDGMKAGEDEFKALMTILCELTKKQVKREEKEIFEKLQAADLDLDALGEEAAELKTDLEAAQTKSKSKAKSQKSKTKPKTKNQTKAPTRSSTPGKLKSKSVAQTKSKSAQTKSKVKPSAKASKSTSSKASSKKATSAGKTAKKTVKKASPSKSTAKKSSAKQPASRSKASGKSAGNKKAR